MAATNIHDVETDHEYDGIREFDNPLPRWWLITFYGAIVFAFGYWFYYQTLDGGGMSAMAVYEQEMVAAEAMQKELASKISPDDLVAMTKDDAALAAGKATWQANCVACHLDKGQGLIGPNLTDAYWLHGSEAKDIYSVVTNGVLAKGMPAWGEMLGPTTTQQVTAYVLTIKNTNVAGKAPQGLNAEGKAP